MPDGAEDPLLPAPQDKEWFARADWLDFHQQLILDATAAGGKCELVFLGDSITQGWAGEGAEVWDDFYKKYNAVNLGIGGDEVQHLTWRVQNGEIDPINPKVAIVLIGTNNIGNVGHKADPVAKGIKLLLDELRARLPQTKILLLGTFPRDPQPGTTFRTEIVELNKLVAKYADQKQVFYMDIGEYLTEADSTITDEVMPDYLHLSSKGYTIWAQTIDRTLKTLLGEDVPPPRTQAEQNALTASTNKEKSAKATL